MVVVRVLGYVAFILGALTVVSALLSRFLAFSVPIGLIHADRLRDGAVRATGYIVIGIVLLMIARPRK